MFDVAKPHHYGPFRGPGCGTFAPSADWSYGGPIIERENLYSRDPDPLARHVDSGFDNKWMAAKANHAKREYEHNQFGETPPIAAMRCYVASKFGNEVPDECPSANDLAPA